MLKSAPSQSRGPLYGNTSKKIAKKITLKNIHWKYLLSHWIITLLLAPFLVQLLMYLTRNNASQIVGLIEVYPITLIVSIIFSIPTYIIYGFIDYLCMNNNVELKINKWILISIALIGILITFLTLFKTKDLEITIGYFLTSLVVGVILRLK